LTSAWGSASAWKTKFDIGDSKDFYAKQTRKQPLPLQGAPGVFPQPCGRAPGMKAAKQAATPAMYLAAARATEQRVQQEERHKHAVHLDSYFQARQSALQTSPQHKSEGERESSMRVSAMPPPRSMPGAPVLCSGTSMMYIHNQPSAPEARREQGAHTHARCSAVATVTDLRAVAGPLPSVLDASPSFGRRDRRGSNATSVSSA
jgi:hypothetical protein